MTTEKTTRPGLIREFSDAQTAWKDYKHETKKEVWVRVYTKKEGKVLEAPEEEEIKASFAL